MILQLSKLSIVALLLVFCGVCADAQTQLRRDLSIYAKGPTFELNNQVIRTELGKYIIGAWKSNSPAYFKVISYSREGHKSDCDMFVEKNQSDTWQITAECLSYDPNVKQKDRIEIIYDTVKVAKMHYDPDAPDKFETVVVLSNSKSDDMRAVF